MRSIVNACAGLVAGFALLVAAGCGGGESGPGGAAPKEIRILWAEWAPADALQKLTEDFTAKSGVKVIVDKKPWPEFGSVKNQEFANRSSTYDLIIGDSQWLGQGVVGGHYVDLTDFIGVNADLFKDVAPAAMSYYAEYPAGSKKYYAVPCESDAMAVAYRKDLFEDARHKEGFKKFVASQAQLEKLGYQLEVPKTWDHLLAISRYFKEASGIEGMAGIVMPTVASYDQAAMSFENILWSFGGDWGDQQKLTATIGSPEATQALTFMKQLVDTSSKQGAAMDYGDVLTTFTSGRSAMAMTYFAFFPSFTSAKDNKNYADKTGYFNVPAGPKGHYTALGGQGMSVNAHISDARKVQSKDFLKWFSSESTQTQWAKLGGFTANTKILETEAFKSAAPYNPLFVDAFSRMKDFWNIPEYDPLLTVAQANISAVLQGKMTPEAATQAIQAEHEKILKGAKR